MTFAVTTIGDGLAILAVSGAVSWILTTVIKSMQGHYIPSHLEPTGKKKYTQ